MLDLSRFLEILGHAPQQRFCESGVLNLPTAEDHRALHFVASFQETLGLTDAHVVIMLIDFVTHLDLFNFGLVRFLFGLFGFFLLLELVFAVIHDPAYRRIGLLADQH